MKKLVIPILFLTILGTCILSSIGFEKIEEEKKQLDLTCETNEIYDGYIKLQKDTIYQEIEKVEFGEEELQQNLEIFDSTSLIEIEKNQEEEVVKELENKGELVYKGIKIIGDNLKETLGQEGKIEILDKEQKLVATIDKEAEYQEDGTVTVFYEQELAEIIVKTSKIQQEGTLILEHIKEIKPIITDIENTKIRTISELKVEDREETVTKENVITISQAKTNITMEANTLEWTNRQQNEITFNISLNANEMKDKLFKNPTIKLELPDEVEKVIIQNTGLFHENGLALQEVATKVNENGRQEIVANLTGEQTEHEQNEIEVTTDIKISAIVILKKDIPSNEAKLKLHYTNEDVISGEVETGMQEVEVQIETYQEKVETLMEQEVKDYQLAEITKETKIQGLQLEVAPVKGEMAIRNDDILYEGEYIKYNIKVTNTTKETMENVTVTGSVPEGTTYGTLKTDFNNPSGVYEYDFLPEIKTVPIEIGTLKPGQSITNFYEVRVNDLEDAVGEKQVTSNIQAKVGEAEAANFTLANTVKQAKYKVFLSSCIYTKKHEWYYPIKVESDENKEVEVIVKLPKQLVPEYFYGNDTYIEIYDETNMPEDNVFRVKVPTNTDGYYIIGIIPPSSITEQTEASRVEIMATASVTEDNITYQSNENRIMYEYENVSISMTSENEGEEVKYDDEINYEIRIKNIGRANLNYPMYSFFRVNLEDILPENVKPISVTYDNWEMEIEQNEYDDPTGEILGGYTYTGKYKKLEPILQELSTSREDENGNKLPDLQLNFTIPYQESVTILVKTKARAVYEKTKVENSATVTGKDIETKTSNTITHTILPLGQEDLDNPDNPDNPGNPENPDNPSNPDDPNNPNNPENPDDNKKYSISGVAWLDENEDGQRQAEEQLLSGIPVLLVNMKEATVVKENVKTGSNGSYHFTDLKKGNYLVLFQYDQNRYHITQYQKNGVSQSYNSDAVDKKLKINGKTETVGMIEVNNLQESTTNMDIGLIEKKVCDLKLDKSISKITVKTNKGTKQYTYHNEKLAKIEIKAKEIEGATVSIEYKMTITNQGEIAATVGRIVDELPEDLIASSNQNWSSKTKKQLINTSLANQRLAPGESTEVTLVATKKMTANTTGTIVNTARIEYITNSSGTEEKDIGNNQSKAEVIISVSTGAIYYISIGIIAMVTIGIAIFLIHKKRTLKIKKIFLLIVTALMLVVTTNAEVQAYDAHYTWDGKDANGNLVNSHSEWFTGGPTGKGLCRTPGAAAHGCDSECTTNTTYYSRGSVDWYEDRESSRKTPSITLRQENTTVQTRIIDNNVIFGPFSVTCDKDVIYTYEIYDLKGNEITGYATCDENGNDKTVRGSSTFYIKMPKEKCMDGVSRIKAKASYTGTCYIYKYRVGGILYYPGDSCQNVGTYEEVGLGEWTETIPQTVKAEVEWTGLPGCIEVIKRDEDQEDKKLPGVQLRLYSDEVRYDQSITTDENGYALFENLPSGYTYNLEELMTPHYGYFPELNVPKKVTVGTLVIIDGINTKHTGNMQIMKKDKDSGKYLSGVGFKVKNDKNEYIIAVDQQGSEQKKVTGEILLGNLHYTPNEEEATEFFTNEDGLIGIYNIITGTYQAIETTIGENNQGYEIDDDYISWETEEGKEIGQGRVATITVERQLSNYTEPDEENTASKHTNILTVNNKRKYVRLSGNVWEDIPWKEKSGLKSNEHLLNKDEYPKDTNDKLLQHVTVKLKDKNENIVPFKDDKGNTFEEIETDEKGHYVMWDVLIDKLEEYYIEFTYNGMKYESVAASIDKEKVGNKAIEKQNRIDYNNQYTTIVKDGRKDEKGNATYDLKYDTTDYTSKIHYGDNLKYGYQGQKYPINGTYENFLIRANTRNAYEGYLNLIETKESIRENAVEEIENINLGVKERLEPDLSLVKDVHNVKVSINKANHVYNYADRYNKRLYGENGTEGEDPFNMEPRVRYESKYGNMSYTRALYPSDVYYNGEDRLRVKVTYKIGIKNKTTIRSIVNEINDYYDSKFYQDTNIIIGTQLDNQGNIVETSKLNYEVEKQSGYDLYYKLRIKDINMDLRQTAEGYIYVELEVKQDQISKIVEDNQAGKEVKLDNIAEIASYSLKDEKGNAYAGIDKNSQPGSVDVNNPKTFEDDTDRAPGLKLILQENRKLNGVVFEDEVLSTDGFKVDEVNYGKIRQGNGIYDQNEKGIGDVTVQLVTVAGDGTERTAKIWNTLARKWEDAITKTKQDGSYYFEGFIPENYKVLYIWGDQTYRVQDYKATIYKDDQHQGEEWYKQVQDRYSDAKDNYQTREEIDEQARLVTNANQKVIEAYGENGQIELTDNRGKQTLKTKMDSRTDLFVVNLEYKKEATYGPDEHTNYLKNIDFGIVERAKQTLKLSKEVKRVKLVLSNGNVLVDAKIGENGEIDDKVKYTTYIPKSGAADGQIKLEVDNEILQSARLEIEYRFKVENISELDYLNEDYYTYGRGRGEIDKDLVALDAKTVIDYLDNNLAKNLDDNDQWEVYSNQDKKDLIDTYGLLGEELRQTLTQTNTVAHTEKLSQYLQPKGIREKEGTLKVYRMLPSVLQDEDSTMGNDAEIIKIVKSGGASVTTIPGNYVLSEGVKEVDEARSEIVTIVPPTGGGINVIAYTLLAISSLGILVSGIILIKRWVLR